MATISWARIKQATCDVLKPAERGRAVTVRLLTWLALLGFPTIATINREGLLPPWPWGVLVWAGAILSALALGVQAVYRLRSGFEEEKIGLKSQIEALEGGRLVLSPQLELARMGPPEKSGLGHYRTLVLNVVSAIPGPFELEVLANTSPTRVLASAHATKDNREPTSVEIVNRRVYLGFSKSLSPPEKRREVISKNPLVVYEYAAFISVTLYAHETIEFRKAVVTPRAGRPHSKSGS